MDSFTSLDSISEHLLAPSAAGIVTDSQAREEMEFTMPNTIRAWTHVVPALEDFAKKEGKRSILGRDKGQDAYNKMIEKLRLVMLGLYGDGVLTIGDDESICLIEIAKSLALFKNVFPNWPLAYLAGHKVFIEKPNDMLTILSSMRASVEKEYLEMAGF